MLDNARFSAISFAYDRPVAFLVDAADRVERVYGFLLLVEMGGMAATFKSGLDLTSAFRKAHLDPIGRTSVERAIARHDAAFEKLNLRNMTTSRFALRSKILRRAICRTRSPPPAQADSFPKRIASAVPTAATRRHRVPAGSPCVRTAPATRTRLLGRAR